MIKDDDYNRCNSLRSNLGEYLEDAESLEEQKLAIKKFIGNYIVHPETLASWLEEDYRLDPYTLLDEERLEFYERYDGDER